MLVLWSRRIHVLLRNVLETESKTFYFRGNVSSLQSINYRQWPFMGHFSGLTHNIVDSYHCAELLLTLVVSNG